MEKECNSFLHRRFFCNHIRHNHSFCNRHNDVIRKGESGSNS